MPLVSPTLSQRSNNPALVTHANRRFFRLDPKLYSHKKIAASAIYISAGSYFYPSNTEPLLRPLHPQAPRPQRGCNAITGRG
jgi:hypothetical protein